ncbi:hypothetical protein ACIRP7_19910 [Streptomyces sp. NPDC102270]|uniref:hypothetical protein n=1 Tax=Streptomyces sp. NPDC102270 TaxID=3366150 RepID=UPI00382A9455
MVVSLTAVRLVLSRAQSRRSTRGSSTYSLSAGVLGPILMVAGLTTNRIPLISATAMLTFTWLSITWAPLATASTAPREPYAPRRSELDPFKPVIDQMLLADLDAPRKQRHTVVRIYRRLINEHATDDVSYQVVRAYVAKGKPEIRVEAGRGPAQVIIEQSHLAGAEAEVYFGESGPFAGRAGEVPFVLPAVVVLREGGAPGVRLRRSGGVLRGPRARFQSAGRRALRQDPVCQPEGCGRVGARLHAAPGRDRPADAVSGLDSLIRPYGSQGCAGVPPRASAIAPVT